MSSKDTDETSTLHSKTNNKEIMMGNETYEIIPELFDSLLQKYQKGLDESMTSSEFNFYDVDLLHDKMSKKV